MTATVSKRAAMRCLAVLALLLALSLPGCGDEESGTDGRPQAGEEAPPRRADPVEETETRRESGVLIHMCGRSVLGAWFEHWGWDYDPKKPVRFDGFLLLYHEVEAPPGIVDSALRVIKEAEPGEVLFLKLCYGDFAGGDEHTAASSLWENERMMEAVAEAALEKGLTVLLGNALPTVAEFTDSWLIWNHRRYNRFLEELASKHPGRVMVLDLYGELASPDGSLRAEYALEPLDSHLNDDAYEALDEILEETLKKLPRVDSQPCLKNGKEKEVCHA